MAESLSPRDEAEWRLLTFLRRRAAAAGDASGFVEVEQVVSGPGLGAVVDFLVADGFAPPLSAAAAAELAAAEAEDRPAVVARLAQRGESALCLRAVDVVLGFYGRVLASAAMSFACRGGLFVGGGILPKLAWRVPALGGAADAAGGGCALLRGYLECGPKMSGFVARVPLMLLEDADAGVKGCLYLALSLLAVGAVAGTGAVASEGAVADNAAGAQ